MIIHYFILYEVYKCIRFDKQLNAKMSPRKTNPHYERERMM